uniref:non-specific serine/threonine protein kinase n=1 Tax=Fagus sylvatica TaxID=28930 RepID=A0A2N9H5Z0_FAGSY
MNSRISSLASLLLFFCLSFQFTKATTNDTVTNTLQQGQSLKYSESIVSANGKFELCFFSPGNSTKYYLGIRYKKVSEQNVVWVANRKYPFPDSSAILTVDPDGNLVISDSSTKSTVANTSTGNGTYAMLLDTGNLILTNKVLEVFWQSFEYPTGYSFARNGTFVFNIMEKFRRPCSCLNCSRGQKMIKSGIRHCHLGVGIMLSAVLLAYAMRLLEVPCGCLKGFEPVDADAWSNGDASSGCVRKTSLQCTNNQKDGFLKMSRVDWTKNPLGLDFVNDKECQSACLNNCSCLAYAYDPKYNRTSVTKSCLVWDDSLLNLKQLSEDGNDFYLKLAPSDLVTIDTSSRNGTSPAVTSAATEPSDASRKLRRKGEDLVKLDLGMTIVSENSEISEANKRGDSRKHEVKMPLFSFKSVSAATDNFSDANKLGEGGFGPVYKGDVVAVKRLSRRSGQGWEELKNEAMLIAKLQHNNLVRLLGCCIERDEKILVYEYMPNKSLDLFLFDPEKRKTLDWQTRIRVIEGVAQGLLYLHQYSRLRIIHRDLKPSNILLDSKMNPKISDFGMARIFGGDDSQANTNRIVGTYGYMSPEYALEGLFSIKSDVFSFGVLLLEIVSGRKNTGFYQTDSFHLLGYAWDLWISDRGSDLVDPLLDDVSSMHVALRYVNIALLCVQEGAADRPTMSDVVAMLSNESAALPYPKQPGFLNLRSVGKPNPTSSGPEICSVNNATLTPYSPGQSITGVQTLISSGQIFELGFFSSGNNNSRYLGIWYKKTPEVLVWIANRNNPLTDLSGVFTINNNGTLILLDQRNDTIWYSNSSRAAQTPVAQLLDSGNFVVKDKVTSSSESYLWESFDYPFNTWLPGMTIGKDMSNGLDRFLTSPGDFTYKFDHKGLPQIFIKRGSMKKFRSGPWNGVRFSGLPMLVHLITLSESGILQRIVLTEGSSEWTIMDAIPNDLCDNYGQCGANSVCRSFKESVCECLEGFTTKSPEEWKHLISSSGCVRRTPLECQRKDGFLKLGRVKLPDLLEFWLNKSMSTEECKAECLKNCSCTAYANSDITGGGNGCLIWFGDLIDIRGYNQENPGQDLYIRLAASELSFIHQCLGQHGAVGLIICGRIQFSLSSRAIVVQRKKEDVEVPLFDFTTVANATNKFSEANVIGAGGFGPVYKGHLCNGQDIAVKRLSKNSRQGLEEFKNEVVLIAKLQHRNLVRLLGYCIQGDERMLIYEYMPNKSLNNFIFEQNGSALLAWPKRFDIVVGIVRGLLYLHQDSRLQVIHRDLKASNILLDINLNSKISDFGLARTFGGDEAEVKTDRVVGT